MVLNSKHSRPQYGLGRDPASRARAPARRVRSGARGSQQSIRRGRRHLGLCGAHQAIHRGQGAEPQVTGGQGGWTAHVVAHFMDIGLVGPVQLHAVPVVVVQRFLLMQACMLPTRHPVCLGGGVRSCERLPQQAKQQRNKR